MKRFRKSIYFLLLGFIVLFVLTTCSLNETKNNKSNEEFIESLSKIDFSGLDEKCFSIIKGKLVKIEEVKFDNSIVKEELRKDLLGIDMSKIPYLSLTVEVEKSTGKNKLEGNIEIIMVKGQLSDKFLHVRNEYIFNIAKAQWKEDKNLIYNRVNILLIDKTNKILINDDGDKKPLSYENEIFKKS